MSDSSFSTELRQNLRKGMVIPAHPLSLTAEGKFDEVSMRALTRYYLDSGAGGVAIAVHTTQFEIRDPEIGLLEPVLDFVSRTIDEWEQAGGRSILKISGICGDTRQAVDEAGLAVERGYHAGLLSLSALPEDASVPEMIAHCREVASVIPVFGFYLQPSIGGRLLPYEFWRQFAEIENVVAIKIAAFNRYQTLDVIRGVCDAGREGDISFYTGNDDNIVNDLLSTYRIQTAAGAKSVRFVGGLLGHWAVWTRAAVQLLDEIHRATEGEKAIPAEWLTRAIEVTDMNAALFDAANEFRGCVPGVHHVLNQQGLTGDSRCLDTSACLSNGQESELERVRASYPHLLDDQFVQSHVERWRAS
jgi:dihydrodipicolinate synthase/N-acetylneuraminate lyase